ncbi:MAG TPA: DUF4167 domain-containing protein [Caulobacteraceae bacterium]|nr:DUF4167 domain-containing protein [Caulobacteraceae bacterium]
MRDFKGMKRQRNRGRGGGGGGGGKPQHNANRAFDSNGPDGVKVRGAAQHIYEKYQQLARDASSAGDRVLAENYLQHAEHYFRVLRAMQPQRPVGEIIGRDQFASGYDIDFEEEPQAAEEGETEVEAAAEGRRDERAWQTDRPRDDRQQGEYRQRDDRPREDRGEYRQRDGQGEYRQRDDRPREDRPRDDRPRDDRYQGDRPRFRDRDDRQGRYQADRQNRPDREYRNDRNGGDRPERDPLGVIEPQATPLTAPAPAYEQPREEAAAGVLRGEDGAMSHAPAFLQPRAPEPRAESDEAPGEARRPRRRRAPRSFEAGEAAAPAEADEG